MIAAQPPASIYHIVTYVRALKDLHNQIRASREALSEMGEATSEQIARRFLRACTTIVQPLLESLAALEQADKTDTDRYAA